MELTDIKHSNLSFGCSLKFDPSKPCKIDREWSSSIPKSPKNRHQGIVYFIVVNNTIVKIGGSSGDIKSLVSQYLINLRSKAEPRENRFCIYLKMLESLFNGDCIQFWYIPVQDMTTYCEGLNGEMLTAIHREFRIVESRLIEQYERMEGSVPSWNNTEGRFGWAPELIALFDNRERDLKNGLNEWFSYESFLNYKGV